MLLSPRPDIHVNINNNMNLDPRRHRQHQDNSNSLSYQLTEQLLSVAPKCYSPRPCQRSKVPPHITICPPDSVEGFDLLKARDLNDDELDNEVFQSPTSTSSPSVVLSTSSDEKHEVHSGRLYLIRHTGNGSASPPSSPSRSPTRSPNRSPCRSPARSFAARTSPPLSNQSWSCNSGSYSSQTSSSSSPPSPSSPTPGRQRMPVYVRVYRCNMDHFAIISRDVIYTSKPIYMNLKHCRVIPGDCLGRFIVAGKCDSGNTIEFETPELSALEQWLDAFQTCTPPASPSRIMGGASGGGGGGMSSNTPPIPRSPALPTLAETDEED